MRSSVRSRLAPPDGLIAAGSIAVGSARSSSAKHHFACASSHQNGTCGISDIVKRRSIRAGSRSTSQDGHCGSLHYLRIIFRRPFVVRRAGCKNDLCWRLLDRNAIGPILRSKLVFLISIRPYAAFIEGARSQEQTYGQHSAECVDIDNESNQVP